jgi:hypothetical protein
MWNCCAKLLEDNAEMRAEPSHELDFLVRFGFLATGYDS